MRNVVLALSLAVATLACQQPSKAAAPDPTTDDQKTLYAVGVILAKQTAVFSFTPEELKMVERGFEDGASGKKLVAEPDAFREKINQLVQARAKASQEKLKGKQQAAYDEAAKEKGAEKTASGLVYVPLKEGAGAQPSETDTVKVHYAGKLVDGTEFDSSYKRNQPAEFPLNGVIKCWTEGVAKMKVGGKAKLVCPAAIAYGEMGRPPTIPGGATLVFEVELLDVVKK